MYNIHIHIYNIYIHIMCSLPLLRETNAIARTRCRVEDRRREKNEIRLYTTTSACITLYYIIYILYAFPVCPETGRGQPPLNGFHYGLFLLRTASSLRPLLKKKKNRFLSLSDLHRTLQLRCTCAELSSQSPPGIVQTFTHAGCTQYA